MVSTPIIIQTLALVAAYAAGVLTERLKENEWGFAVGQEGAKAALSEVKGPDDLLPSSTAILDSDTANRGAISSIGHAKNNTLDVDAVAENVFSYGILDPEVALEFLRGTSEQAEGYGLFVASVGRALGGLHFDEALTLVLKLEPKSRSLVWDFAIESAVKAGLELDRVLGSMPRGPERDAVVARVARSKPDAAGILALAETVEDTALRHSLLGEILLQTAINDPFRLPGLVGEASLSDGQRAAFLAFSTEWHWPTDDRSDSNDR